jgi:hypothetical protein
MIVSYAVAELKTFDIGGDVNAINNAGVACGYAFTAGGTETNMSFIGVTWPDGSPQPVAMFKVRKLRFLT